MTKLRLFGLADQKQKVLNLLFKFGNVCLKKVEEIENTFSVFNEKQFLFHTEKCKKIDDALLQIAMFARLGNQPINIGADDFLNFDLGEKADELVQKIDSLFKSIEEAKKQKDALFSTLDALKPYECVPQKFSHFCNTKSACVVLGIVNTEKQNELENLLAKHKNSSVQFFDQSSVAVVMCLKEEAGQFLSALAEIGFSKCPFDDDQTPKAMISSVNKKIKLLEKDELVAKKQICECAKSEDLLKLARDHSQFCAQVAGAENFLRSTKQAFVLEAYLPTSAKEDLQKLFDESKLSLQLVFSKPAKDEVVPTLTKNNKVVKPFEFVTNMYSPPSYNEFDPNSLVMIFFSIFFGFIMADIGYGILLTVVGLLGYAKIKKEGGLKSLFGVFGIGGIFSFVFGIMFGSFFGFSNQTISFLPPAIFPDPTTNVMMLLGICLGAGGVQIMVSLALKAILLFKRKRVLEAIFNALVWEVFFVGVFMLAFYVAGIAPKLLELGIFLCGMSVISSAVGQIFVNKGIERVFKGVGSVYGVINIFSDILSYARIFGLMLSGYIISGIVDQLALPFLQSTLLAVLGVIVMLIGHTFNIAIGVLGAYIHVSRLQYIEFFSRFYTGEGVLFEPFGSGLMYVNIVKND